MKVLMINGSANERGCTFTALSEVGKPLQEQGIETEIIQLGKQAYRDCIGWPVKSWTTNAFLTTTLSTGLSKKPDSPTALFSVPPFILPTPADVCCPF